MSYVSLVGEDLGGQEELVLHHQRQHPHEPLGGISEEGGLREGRREGGREAEEEGGEYGGQR